MPRGRVKQSLDVKCRCLTCGKRWTVPEWQKSPRKFCSRPCFHKSMVGQPRPTPHQITKGCERCGTEFVTGGSAGRVLQRFCSIACANSSDGRSHPAPSKLSMRQAAYLAGLFDGEGSIVRSKPRVWRIVVYQSEREVLDWIKTVTGTGFIGVRQPSSLGRNLVKQSAFKPSHFWQISGRNAATLLRQMRPFMIVKAAKADEMLSEYASH